MKRTVHYGRCDVCNGRGTVTPASVNDYSATGFKMITCARCNGGGFVMTGYSQEETVPDVELKQTA